MQLWVQLMSGTGTFVEAANDDLVREVAARAARQLKTRRLRLVTAVGVCLLPTCTIAQAGLAAGEQLTGVVVQEITDVRVAVHLTGNQERDIQRIRDQLAKVDGAFVAVFPQRFQPRAYSLDHTPWHELAGAEGLDMSGSFVTADEVEGVIRGLGQLPQLCMLRLSANQWTAASWSQLSRALPESLEELALIARTFDTNALGDALRRFTGLRSLELRHGDMGALRSVLPESLEHLGLELFKVDESGGPPCLPPLPLLRSVRLEGIFHDPSCGLEDVGKILCALPAELEELDLSNMSTTSALRGYAADEEALARGMRHLARLRRFHCPRREGRLVLPFLPDTLEVLDLQLPTTVALAFEAAAYVAALARLAAFSRQLTRVTFVCIDTPSSVWEGVLTALPPSIEHFWFRNAFFKDGGEAVARCLHRFPRLRTLKLHSLVGKDCVAVLSSLPWSLESLEVPVIQESDVNVLRQRLTKERRDCLLKVNLLLDEKWCKASPGPGKVPMSQALFRAMLEDDARASGTVAPLILALEGLGPLRYLGLPARTANLLTRTTTLQSALNC